MNNSQTKALDYLKQAHRFQLGKLTTESSHSQTRDLTTHAHNNLSLAIEQLLDVDLSALKKLTDYLPHLENLTTSINDTLTTGGRIFLCGCGATGRLSLSLEFLWRQHKPDSNSVISFIAGGDTALVNSIEGFEDYAEYGVEHLTSLGFSENDLLICSSEGGETSFVIGATEKAAAVSKRKPYFLYCNPRELLIEQIERSRNILLNPKIHSICLDVGPMALSGSTRMQASTVLMLAIGMSLFHHDKTDLTEFINFLENSNVTKLKKFIELEYEVYRSKNKIIYATDEMAITVFTDVTERSPTFSLPPLGNKIDSTPDQSLAYLMIPSTHSGDEAWHKLLARPPRLLNWNQRSHMTTAEYLGGFDFSNQVLNNRIKTIPEAEHIIFSIQKTDHSLIWRIQGFEDKFKTPNLGNLFDHIYLKILLNIHSTLIMAKLGRTASNFMTFVSPTNGKLVDRAARYALLLLKQSHIENISYETVVFELFHQLENRSPGESVVIKTYEALQSTTSGDNRNHIKR